MADEGLKQAKETAEALSQYNFKHAFVSPFTRTVQTANQILQKHPNLTMRLENGVSEYVANDESHPPLIEGLLSEFTNIDATYKSKMPLPVFESKKGLFERAKQIMKHISET